MSFQFAGDDEFYAPTQTQLLTSWIRELWADLRTKEHTIRDLGLAMDRMVKEFAEGKGVTMPQP